MPGTAAASASATSACAWTSSSPDHSSMKNFFTSICTAQIRSPNAPLTHCTKVPPVKGTFSRTSKTLPLDTGRARSRSSVSSSAPLVAPDVVLTAAHCLAPLLGVDRWVQHPDHVPEAFFDGYRADCGVPGLPDPAEAGCRCSAAARPALSGLLGWALLVAVWLSRSRGASPRAPRRGGRSPDRG